jgi:hypothetical protein
MARIAEESMLALAAGPNLLLKESLVRKLAKLKAELAGPAPPLLDRLLAERVAICWLGAAFSDAAYAQGKGHPAPVLEHARRRQDSAGRRYAEALKPLATVRKLLSPGRDRRNADAGPHKEAVMDSFDPLAGIRLEPPRSAAAGSL